MSPSLNCSQAAFRRKKRFRKCVTRHSSRWHTTLPHFLFLSWLDANENCSRIISLDEKKKMLEVLMEKIESWLLRWKKRLICRGFRKEFASSRYFRACHKSRNTYFELDMPYFRLGLKFVSYILLVILHLALR